MWIRVEKIKIDDFHRRNTLEFSLNYQKNLGPTEGKMDALMAYANECGYKCLPENNLDTGEMGFKAIKILEEDVIL